MNKINWLIAGVVLALAPMASATRFFNLDGGDISVSGNWTGSGNYYLQGAYNNTVYSGYLPAGKKFSVSAIVYVFNGFTLNIQGGTFEALLNATKYNPSFSIGKGVVNQSGGTVNVGPVSPSYVTRTLCLGYSNEGLAEYNLSGGALNVRGDSLLMVRGTAPATFTQTGGTLNLSGGKGQAVILGYAGTDGNGTYTGSATATFNLCGGTAQVGRFYSCIATPSYLNLDGGTIQPLAASTEFIGSATDSKGLTVSVRTGGAVFDTAYDIVSRLPLTTGLDAGTTDGGLTKKGVGKLTLATGNTYTGPTAVNAGSLLIAKGETFAGALTVSKDARVGVRDVAATDEGQVVATFTGGITLAADATAPLVMSVGDPCVALAVAADGQSIVARTLAPHTLTNDLELADVDYEGEADLVLDLNGHNLTLRSLDGLAGLQIVDSSETPGSLIFSVPANTTATAKGQVQIADYIPVKKIGAGTLVWARNDTAKTCDVVEGTLKGGINNGLFATLTVEAGATFDFNGSYNHTAMKIVSHGGTLTCTGTALNWNNATFGELEITADTRLTTEVGSNVDGGRCNGVGLNVNWASKVTLHGKKLTVAPTPGKVVWFFGTTFADAGTLEFASGGYLCLHAAPLNAAQVTLVHSGGAFILNQPVTLANYTVNTTDDTWSYGTNVFNVAGTFTPHSQYFMNTKMLNGSTVDLSTWTTPFSVKGTLSRDLQRYLTFDAQAEVTIDVHGRTFTQDLTKVIDWTEIPDGTTFKLDAESRQLSEIRLADDGLYVRHRLGTTLFVR